MFWNKKTVDNNGDVIPTEFGWIEYSSSEPTMKDMKAEKRVLEQKIGGLLDEFKLKFDVELKAEIVIQM